MSYKLASALGISMVLALSTATGVLAATKHPIRSDQAAAQRYARSPVLINQEQRANERVGPDQGGAN